MTAEPQEPWRRFDLSEVWLAVSKLTPELAEPFRLRFFSGWHVSRIANILRIEEFDVERRLVEARHQLRKVLLRENQEQEDRVNAGLGGSESRLANGLAGPEYDVFISCAPDGDTIAQALSEALTANGAKTLLTVARSRRRPTMLEQLLDSFANSRNGVVILSPLYTRSVWSAHDFRIAMAHAYSDQRKLIPILHQIEPRALRTHWIPGDYVALPSDMGVPALVRVILHTLSRARKNRP